jgi:replicative DNA helicase
MRRGTLDDADWAGVSNAVRRMRGAPMFISKPGSARIEHICAQIRRQHAETPLGLVVLDYLQLVEIRCRRVKTLRIAIGRVTRALVNLSQELQVPILVLSQLNRDSEKEQGSPRRITDARLRRDRVGRGVRDAGLSRGDERPGQQVPRHDRPFVDLNRNGPPGECRLGFDGAKYRCENLPKTVGSRNRCLKRPWCAPRGFKRAARKSPPRARTSTHEHRTRQGEGQAALAATSA